MAIGAICSGARCGAAQPKLFVGGVDGIFDVGRCTNIDGLNKEICPKNRMVGTPDLWRQTRSLFFFFFRFFVFSFLGIWRNLFLRNHFVRLMVLWYVLTSSVDSRMTLVLRSLFWSSRGLVVKWSKCFFFFLNKRQMKNHFNWHNNLLWCDVLKKKRREINDIEINTSCQTSTTHTQFVYQDAFTGNDQGKRASIVGRNFLIAYKTEIDDVIDCWSSWYPQENKWLSNRRRRRTKKRIWSMSLLVTLITVYIPIDLLSPVWKTCAYLFESRLQPSQNKG